MTELNKMTKRQTLTYAVEVRALLSFRASLQITPVENDPVSTVMCDDRNNELMIDD